MATSTLVNISEGTVQGKELTAGSFSRKKYFAFQGIPYAQPPVGNLRFKDPRPPLPWQGVKEAVQEPPSCPQVHVVLKERFGEEDNCLALNVYTPSVMSRKELKSLNSKLVKGIHSYSPLKEEELPSKDKSALPVMVWIHGGGFTFGSGNADMHDPEYWMERDVVVVTCNYRVGALGFLSLGTADVPGNAGLKDQVMVLRWVRRNIAQFTGDPNNVTLFGESAGAASVHYHLLSPMSRGLFHRAILMSGCSLNSWAFIGDCVARSFRLGDKLGKKTNDAQELLSFLQGVPALDLVKFQSKVVTAQDKQDNKVFPFVPCIEPKEGEGERFLTEHPRTLLQQGKVAAVPLIIGATDKEGMLTLNDVPHTDDYFKVLNGNFSRVVPKDLALPPGAPDKIKQFFFSDEAISWDTISKYFDFYGDIFFYIGLDEAIRLHLATALAPVYCYKLTFDGRFGFLSWALQLVNPGVNLKGVCHADDIGYIFKSNIPTGPPQMSDLPDDAPEIQMVASLTTMFRQFAATGNPNQGGESVRWDSAVKEGTAWRNYLELNTPPVMRTTRLEPQRMEFWDSLLRPHSNL